MSNNEFQHQPIHQAPATEEATDGEPFEDITPEVETPVVETPEETIARLEAENQQLRSQTGV